MSAPSAPDSPTLTRHAGVAGQFSITVEFGLTRQPVTFVGSCYGSPGPVVMVMGNVQTFVTDPGRFGEKFDQAWVQAFVGAGEEDQ